jgi:hypothetical protein
MITYTIDPTRRLVAVTVTGSLTLEDALMFQSRVKAHAAFDPTFSQITDCTNVAVHDLDASGLRAIAMNAPYKPGARRAFVVAKDLGFGLGRMFQTYSEDTSRGDVGIFRDYREALAWVLGDRA